MRIIIAPGTDNGPDVPGGGWQVLRNVTSHDALTSCGDGRRPPRHRPPRDPLLARPRGRRRPRLPPPASVPLDAEQARLADPRTTALVERAGFGDFVRRFPAALCTTRTPAEAERLLDSWGRSLWQASVRRAQGQRPGGDLATGDDRPLYWARLSMTAALARWQPAFAVDRAALRTRFEDASRGLADNAFRTAPGVRRVFISGFDPFGLDAEIRRANPSGSAALQLNGRRVTLADGSRAEIRAVVLPVRYADFDAGIVERAFAPAWAPDPPGPTSSPPSARATPASSPWRTGRGGPGPPTRTPTTRAPSPAAPASTR